MDFTSYYGSFAAIAGAIRRLSSDQYVVSFYRHVTHAMTENRVHSYTHGSITDASNDRVIVRCQRTGRSATRVKIQY
jgi:hypothetical protein